jgi:hypothetical protein
MIESRPRLRRLSRMNHGKPVGPALSPTCTLGQAFRGRKTDEGKSARIFHQGQGRETICPVLKAGSGPSHQFYFGDPSKGGSTFNRR